MRWLALITVCTLASMLGVPAQGQPAREPSHRPIVVEVHDDGFDWADAGIGGAAVLGLVLAGAGAALVVRPPKNRPVARSDQKGAAMHNAPALDKPPNPDRPGSRGPSLQRRRP